MLAPSTRRAFLVYGSGTAVAALGTGGVGKALREGRNVEAQRAAVATRGLDLPESVADRAVTALDRLDTVPGISSYMTPTRGFYRIDTALTVPQVNPEQWRLKVGGLVEAPYELTYDEILALPQEEHAITLSCVSNEIGGELVGNAVWTGVPLRVLLRARTREGGGPSDRGPLSRRLYRRIPDRGGTGWPQCVARGSHERRATANPPRVPGASGHPRSVRLRLRSQMACRDPSRN